MRLPVLPRLPIIWAAIFNSPSRSRGSCYCLINNDFYLLAIGKRAVPGIFWCLLTEPLAHRGSPKVKISRPAACIFNPKAEHPLSPATRPLGVKQAKTDGDIQIKKVATMKSERFTAPKINNHRKTNSHINSQGKASSLRFNQIKRTILWLAGIIGAIIGLTLWAFLRPIFRGVGWVISIISALVIIYWIMTL